MAFDSPLNSGKLNIIAVVLKLYDAHFGSAPGYDKFLDQSEIPQLGGDSTYHI
jgi:hypothetical protein